MLLSDVKSFAYQYNMETLHDGCSLLWLLHFQKRGYQNDKFISFQTYIFVSKTLASLFINMCKLFILQNCKPLSNVNLMIQASADCAGELQRCAQTEPLLNQQIQVAKTTIIGKCTQQNPKLVQQSNPFLTSVYNTVEHR